jgi:hypothetical protein
MNPQRRPRSSVFKRKREPIWRNQVTVCIAAICQQDKENTDARIVVCSDWKSETDWGGSETADKLRLLPKGWVALMADQLSRCEELVAQYETHLRDLREVSDDRHLFEEMKKPAHKQKEVLANDYLRQMLGISYADLVSPDKKFPEEMVNKRLEEVAKIRLRAALIIAGFIETTQGEEKRENLPYLFVVDDGGDHEDVVRVEDNFAAIGSGAYVAIPTLHQRGHEEDKSLMETIYSVYEAKRLAEIVPGVGEATSLDVIYPDGRMMTWTDELNQRCKWLFDRLGPKLKIGKAKAKEYFGECKDEFFEPFDDDNEKPH